MQKQNFFYIAVRTYPFWAIPLATAFIATGLKVKKRKLLLLLGIVMVITSVLFIAFRGHETAVPFVHKILSAQGMPGDY
jgi:cytosine/uracil/thiamine/allantoin permease